MTGRILEVCVDSAGGLGAALAGGADRIELCSALEVGGLTPSAGLMRLAARAGRPVLALIRPRAGGFVYGPQDAEVMLDDIAAARAAGLAGVVVGASLPDGRLDAVTLARLADAARGMEVVLNRCFDLVPDFAVAVGVAADLGFTRILTSGGAASALEGAAALARILELAAGRIGVLPAGGITAATVAPLLARLAMDAVHASCSGRPEAAAPLGFGAAQVTDAAAVRALKAALG